VHLQSQSHAYSNTVSVNDTPVHCPKLVALALATGLLGVGHVRIAFGVPAFKGMSYTTVGNATNDQAQEVGSGPPHQGHICASLRVPACGGGVMVSVVVT
jgi:hypothetical protein